MTKRVRPKPDSVVLCGKAECSSYSSPLYLKERMTAWLDALPQYRAIAQRARQRLAPHAVAAVAMAATDRTRTPPRHTLPPTPHRGAAGVVEAAAAGVGPGVAQGHAGRDPVRLLCTHPPNCERSRQSAKTSRSERLYPTFATFFFATRGMTGKVSPKSFMIYSNRSASRCGSAKKTSSSVRHCSAKSIRAWQNLE